MLFGGARVLAFESRRAKEIAELIRLNAGQATVAPALVEVALEDNREAFEFADRLYGGGFEMVVFLTGVGARFLGRVIAVRDGEERLPQALRTVMVVARGPKPMAVMREWQVPVRVAVPEPNTYRELLDAVRAYPAHSVAVQEYGRPNQELIAGLIEQGRQVTSVPVYQWRLPEQTEPLERALDGLLGGEYAAVLFTTGVQIDHFLQIAEARGQKAAAIGALRECLVGSIGPTCSEALREHGIAASLEPSHPKMGILVRETALAYAERQA